MTLKIYVFTFYETEGYITQLLCYATAIMTINVQELFNDKVVLHHCIDV